MGAFCCCFKKKKDLVIVNEIKEDEYRPTDKLIKLMETENTVRMINGGDLDNAFLSVFQILIEIDELVAFFIHDEFNRDGQLFLIIQDIF